MDLIWQMTNCPHKKPGTQNGGAFDPWSWSEAYGESYWVCWCGACILYVCLHLCVCVCVFACVSPHVYPRMCVFACVSNLIGLSL